MNSEDKLNKITRHIDNVQINCMLLGERLITSGAADLGRLIIARGYVHDNSKFYGIEWDYLFSEDEAKRKLAISHHNRTNDHHPEFWGGIKFMPPVAVGELVCDWKTRANEFGTSLQDWINGDAAKRFKYEEDDEIYKVIKYFAELLCDKPFKQQLEIEANEDSDAS